LITSSDAGQSKHGRELLDNTKNKILDSKVRFDVFNEESSNGTTIRYGYTDEKGIHFNMNPAAAQSPEITIAHEENHALNYLNVRNTPPVDQFLSEYRAFLVGREISLKHTLTPGDEADIAGTLLRFYPRLKDAYNENNGANPFNATIKVLQEKLAKGETVSAEQLRVGITTGWGRHDIKPIITPYLNKPGNDDNH